MPIRELVDYFNDRLNQTAVRHLPDEPLCIHGSRVVARFGEYQFSSRFRTIRDVAVWKPWGHLADTVVHNREGHAIRFDIDTLPPPSIVHLDRLVRIAHMLNHLVECDANGLLVLPVNREHVLAVDRDHGRYFEDVLHRCGLGKERVFIALRGALLADTHTPKAIAALRNYRERGYRLAVGVGEQTLADVSIDWVLRVQPDLVQFERGIGRAHREIFSRQRYKTLVDLLTSAGMRTFQEGVDTEAAIRLVLSSGVDFAEGPGIDAEVADRPWHCERPTRLRLAD